MLAWFFKADRGADLALRWFAVYSGVTGAFAWLSKNVSWFGQLTWPQAVLLGLVSALGAMLVSAAAFALGAHAYRLVRPVQVSESSVAQAHVVSYDEAPLAARVAELERIKRAIIDDYQRMCGMEARYEEAHEHFRRDLAGLAGLPEKLEMVRVDGSIAIRDLKKLSVAVKDHRDRTLSAFHALRVRQELATIEVEMTSIYNDLTARLFEGQTYDLAKWDSWESCFSAWLSKLDEWLELGQWYALAVKERVKTIADEKYDTRLNIPDAQFPHSDAVRRFKRFAILHDQWMMVAPEVQRGAFSVAFTGLSEKEVRNGREAG